MYAPCRRLIMLAWPVVGVGLLMAVTMEASGPRGRADRDVAEQVNAARSRVLVELRVESGQDPAAISAVQDRVLAALPQEHAALVRRYASVPMLALDVDAEGLRVLGRLAEVVRVRTDSPKRPQ